jgi:hypothetical protein
VGKMARVPARGYAHGARSPRSVRARDSAVARMLAAQLCLVGDKVLPVSTGETPRRRRTGSRGRSSPE